MFQNNQVAAIAILLAVGVGINAARKTDSSQRSDRSGSIYWERDNSNSQSSIYGNNYRAGYSNGGSNRGSSYSYHSSDYDDSTGDFDDKSNVIWHRANDNSKVHSYSVTTYPPLRPPIRNYQSSMNPYQPSPDHVTLPLGAYYVASGSALPLNVIYVQPRPSKEELSSGDATTIGNILYYSYSRRKATCRTPASCAPTTINTSDEESTAPNDLICLQIKVDEPNPQNPAMTVRNGKTICYPAAESESLQRSISMNNE